MSRSAIGALLALAVVSTGCDRATRPRAVSTTPEVAPQVSVGHAAAASTPSAAPSSSPTPARPPVPTLTREAYAWLASDAVRPPEVEPLAARFEPPAGFTRVEQAPASFGAWLRGLPLAAPGTPVVTYRGEVRYPATDRRIAAVVAIDVGTADLQQCADSVIRLHAEWLWTAGRRDLSYRAAAGMELPYARFLRGERVAMDGNRLVWQAGPASGASHASLRRYLEMVFAWANTGSLARQAAPVPPEAVRPGDFFVLPGNPGHTVLVLDLARDAEGHTVALIGQSYMPAQSFYVLRGERDAWFTLTPGTPVNTPFWEPFPWEALRRLDGPAR